MDAVLIGTLAQALFQADAPVAAPIAASIAAPLAAIVAAGPEPAGSSVFLQVFPLTMLLILGIAVPGALLVANAVLSKLAHGTRNTTAARMEPYESGLASVVGTAGERFDVKFYLIAMLFLAFDIEVAFLYPWAMHFKVGGWGMVGALLVFLLLLEVGYLYLYKKGALDWDK